MKEYLLCIMGTVLFCSILTAVMPEGKTSAIIKSITRTVCVLAIIAPISTLLQKEKNDKFSDNLLGIFQETGIWLDGDFINYYSEMRINEAELRLAEDITSKFNVSAVVNLEWENVSDSIKIKAIRVTADGTEEIEEMMWEYLTKNYCSEVLIE